jgi:ABC-type lipoprotein release transport system permease subunit
VTELALRDLAAWAAHAKSSAPRMKKFRVTGIFYSGFDEYDRRLMYTSLQDTQDLVARGDQVMGVEMKVKDVDRAEEIARSSRTRSAGRRIRSRTGTSSTTICSPR